MKGTDLIKLIKEKGLEDFDIHFSIGGCVDNTDKGCTNVIVKDLCLDDICYSSKVLCLGFGDYLGYKLKVEYR